MNASLEIVPLQPVRHDGWIRFSCELVRKDVDDLASKQILWYEIQEEFAQGHSWNNAEPYLIASILQAMQEGRDLFVSEEVSHALLANLQEYAYFWHRKLPGRFHNVVINAAPCVQEKSSFYSDSNTAIAAFSGGLDASFLVWRHFSAKAGHQTKKIVAGVFISGFDIVLNNKDTSSSAYINACDMLSSLDIPVFQIRTNLREVFTVPWEWLHGTSLASCLHFFAHLAPVALVASCESYDSLVIPWGSSPLVDHLLSSHAFHIVHDGCGYSRTDKAGHIDGWQTAKDRLRVCWNMDLQGRNCMSCEKCLRTMANFLVSGSRIPSSLGGDPGNLSRKIFFVSLRTAAQESEWRSLVREAREKNIHALWTYWVAILIMKYRIRYVRRSIKGVFIKLLNLKPKHGNWS